MKKYIIIFIAGILLCSMSSCSNKKKTREERVQEFRNELTAEDTATMLKLCDNAMEALKAKNIDKVLADLYEYTDSTQEIKPLTDKTKKEYRNKFKLFPVLSYSIPMLLSGDSHDHLWDTSLHRLLHRKDKDISLLLLSDRSFAHQVPLNLLSW